MNTPLPIWFQESMVSMATHQEVLLVGCNCNDVALLDYNPNVTLFHIAKGMSL